MKDFIIKFLLGSEGFNDYKNTVSKADSKETKESSPAAIPVKAPAAKSPLIGTIVRGSFIRSVKHGALYGIGQSKAAFLPKSLWFPLLKKVAKPLGLKVKDLEYKPLDFKIIDLSDDGSCIVEVHGVPDETVQMVKGEIEARHELIRAAMTDMKVGDKIPVKIVKIVRFGAFVETMTGFPGLIHKSKVGDGTLEEWPEELHKIGDVVEATTVKVDRDQRKVAYSLRAAEGGSK